MQFLYSGGDEYTFMNTDTYEQFTYQKSQLSGSTDLLKENTIAKILLYREEPIALELPIFLELKVVETDPGAFVGIRPRGAPSRRSWKRGR